MRIASIFVVLAMAIAPASSYAADKPVDQLTKGSIWKGEGEFADGKVGDRGLRITDVLVKITDRKEAKFKGEVWVDKGARGLTFEGLVTDGGIEIVFGKPIKGEWDKRWPGRKGTLQTTADLLSCEFTGSRKSDTPADSEHFKARRQAK